MQKIKITYDEGDAREIEGKLVCGFVNKKEDGEIKQITFLAGETSREELAQSVAHHIAQIVNATCKGDPMQAYIFIKEFNDSLKAAMKS